MSPLLSSFLTLSFLALSPSTGISPATTLTVAAASDLSLLAPDLAQAFEKSNPTVKVVFVHQASAVLAQQIENGAPYDVFLSANALFADRLSVSGKLKGAAVPYAVGQLALLWRDGKTHPLEELAGDSIRYIALPNPKLAPYGEAAVEALKHADLWRKIERKIVYGENVRQTLQLFDSGNADAVITSDGLVHERGAQLIPAASHSPIVQKAGVVAASPRQKEANMFLQFLLSAEGQAIFARHGFGRPSA